MHYIIFYCLFYSLNAISPLTAAQALTTKEIDGQVCPDGWVKYGIYCYLFQTGNPTQSGKSWTDSFSSCLNNGGNLLSVADQEENIFILNYLKNNSMNDLHFWIGLNNLQRRFVWSDNTTPLFFNWRQDQPDNSFGEENCVEVSSYGWSDASCNNLYGFVCKIKKEVFGCLNSLFEFGGYCYLFHSGSATQNGLSWKMSLTVCQTMGGNLLSVTSQAENSFIINHLKNNSMNELHFWIGLNNLQRTFAWSDHTALLFFDWNKDQPNNYLGVENCVALNFNGWYDTSCDDLLGFICKFNGEFNGQICPNGWIKYGIYCYLFQNGNAALNGKNWINSLSYCLNNGGNLLSVANQTENLFILNYLKNNSINSFFWIGLNTLQRSFVWSDNTAPLFFNWRPGQPDNYLVKEHCVEINSYGWNDANCDNLYGFICKVKKEVFGCPSNLFEYGDYCYLFASESATQNGLSWQMSLVVCKTMQGNLLNVADQAENLFILNHLRNISINDLHFWIGLNNLQRTYVWSDHKTSLFYSWSQGQPDNYSSLEVCVDVTSNGWSDATCDNTYGYICKTKQACGGTCNGLFTACVNNVCQCYSNYTLINGVCTGIWGNWVYGTCSQTCGDGIISRHRTCLNYVQCFADGSYKLVQIQENLSCNLQSCDKTSKIIVGIVVPVSGCILFAVVFTICYRKKTNRNKSRRMHETSRKDFKLEKEISQGAFGNVSIQKINSEVLAKLIHATQQCGASPNQDNFSVSFAVKISKGKFKHEKFQKEIELMNEIKGHKNILNFIGYSEYNSKLCLIVEFMDNGDLLQYLTKFRNKVCTSKIDGNSTNLMNFQQSIQTAITENSLPFIYNETHLDIEDLTPTDLLSFALQIASGMNHLSSIKIVHRALAARNIFVNAKKIVKISDFGLARKMSDNDMNYISQNDDSLPFHWMSIEALNDHIFTSFSDVWAYGVVLFEIVTLGGVPYPKVKKEDFLEYLKAGNRMERPNNCSEFMYDVMLSCWKEVPAQRPTFEKLSDHFEEILHKEGNYFNFDIDQNSSYYEAINF